MTRFVILAQDPLPAAALVGQELVTTFIFEVKNIPAALYKALGGFATNGCGDLSPGKYSMVSVLVCEVVMTAMFLFVIMGATDSRAPAGFAPIAIGLCLTLIHLISIPVTNTSVNPARSTGVAFFVGDWALGQLWLFWVAPIVGAILGALAYRAIATKA